MVLFVTFIVAACSIIYELGFSYIISVLYGNTTAVYSTTIGLFLFFLGIGAYIYEYLKIDNKKLLYIVEFLLSLVGLSSIILLYIFYIEIDNRYIAMILSYIIVIMIAFLSGMEIPILTNLRSDKKFSKVLSIDYFGSLLGTLLYAYILLPKLNIIYTIIFTSLINILITLIVSIYYKDKKVAYLFGIILIIYISIINIFDIEKTIRSYYIENKIKNINMTEYKGQVKPNKVHINSTFDTKYQEVVDANITLYPNKNSSYERRCIYLNGNQQICSDWVDEYHTFLVDVPLLMFNKNRKLNVLILGGGDLIAVKHLLDDNRVKHIDLVDIDKKFVEYCKKNVKYNNGVFNDKRVNIIIDDAYNYVMNINNKNKYDIIINDLPVITNEQLLSLLSVEFYTKLNIIIKDDGILSTLSNSGNQFKEIDVYSCSGFKKILITQGFNINPNKYISYIDKFFYITKNSNFIIKIDSTKNIDKNIVNKLYNNSIEYKLVCHDKDSVNSIFKLDNDLIMKNRFK